MRRWAPILLGIVYVLVMARPALPHVLFSLNKGYIQSSLCEQRGNVRNCCKGACFMRKQVRQALAGDAEQFLVTVVTEEVEQWAPFLTMLPHPILATVPAVRVPVNDMACDQFALEQLAPPPWKPFLA